MVEDRAISSRNLASVVLALVAIGAAHVGCSGDSRLLGVTSGGGSISTTSGAGGSGSGTTSSTTGGSIITGTGGGPSGSAADLAGKLGKKNFLIGLGPRESMYPPTGQLDIRYIYMVSNKD